MRRMNRVSHFVAACLVASLAPAVTYAADDPHAHHRHHMSKPVQADMAKVTLPSVPLLNQYGEEVNIKDDVIGERIAVVSFAYTTCTTVCPVVTAIFSQVHEKLNGLMGKEVELVTITVDPNRDTPARLLAYSKKFNADTGWSWLTGAQDNVTTTLTAFGAYTVNFEDHPAMIMVGDAEKNRWYRYYGFSSPDEIESKVKELLRQRAEQKS